MRTVSGERVSESFASTSQATSYTVISPSGSS